MEKIADLIEEFSDEVFDETFGREDFEKKDISQPVKDELKKALESINKYREDLPSDLKSGMDLLLKFVAMSFNGKDKERVEKINKGRQGGPFPNLTAQIFGTKEKED